MPPGARSGSWLAPRQSGVGRARDGDDRRPEVDLRRNRPLNWKASRRRAPQQGHGEPMSRVIVITGASEGIGALLARSRAAKGDFVVLGARRKDRLDQVAGGLGPDALAVATDVTRRAEV